MIRRFLKMLFLVSLAVLGAASFLNSHFEELFAREYSWMLKRPLRKRTGEAAQGVLDEARLRYGEIIDRHRGNYTAVVRFHLANAAFTLALYRALEPLFRDKEERVQVAHELMWEAGMKGPASLGTGILRSRDNRWELFCRSAGVVNRRFFPPPEWAREEVEVEGGFGFDYSRCLYHDFFTAEGAPELTTAVCDMDWRLAELLPPGIEMVREHTLGAGDDTCDFRYYRRD